MNFGTLKTSILVMPLPCPRSDVCAHHEHPAHADDGAPGEHANSRAPPLRIQRLNATHAVNDSLNYPHWLSHSTVLADQLPHPDDG